MQIAIKGLLGVIAVCFVLSCNDIIDKKLDSITVKIYNPADSFVTSSYNVVFMWEQVSGASGYRIQVVQPDFSNIQSLILDTLVNASKFSYVLLPGNYQWRLRAENGSSSSLYITRKLKVDTNSDLNGQNFSVISPINNYAVNSSVVNFSWSAFPYANQYQYVLMDTTGIAIHNRYSYGILLTDTIYEGVFLWKVRAIDTGRSTATMFSTPNRLIIDLTPPAPSAPLAPLNNSVDSNVITLTWSAATGVYGDSVHLALDSLFQNYVYKTYLEKASSSVLPVLTINKTYYWRLRSRDQAGNWSSYSSVYKFLLQ